MAEPTPAAGPPAQGATARAFADPTSLVRLSTAYWDSQVFLTANRLKLFDVLAAGPKSTGEISATLGLHVRPAKLFLNACVALGLLTGKDDVYENSAVSRAFLVSGSPGYMGNAVLYSDHLYGTWGRLEQGLKQADPVLPPQSYLGGDPNRTRAFVYGMHDRATGLARSLVGMVDLGGRRQLLDVGGGPGTYSILFTQRYPQLESTVLELEGVVQVAREIVAAANAEARVKFQVGDYQTSAFPSDRDVVLMSGMFHRETEQTCRGLIEKARRCLLPGGMLIVSDVFADSGGTGPAFATLFGLNMMLTARDGGVHADADVADWLRAAGFHNIQIRHFPPPMPHRVVVGALP